jgi:hypothetical protein
MTLLIFSDMPTFAVVLNLKQLSWHALLNSYLPYSDSWHAAVNFDIKRSMNCMGMHNVTMHDVAVHDMALHDVAMHDVTVHIAGIYCGSMHGMDVPGGKKKTQYLVPI